jgi:hypothetical protein
MFVFDPLAVLLLIAVNMSLKARYGWSFEGKGALDINGTNGTTVIEKEVVRDVGDKVDLSVPPGIRELEKKISEKLKKG